MPTVLIVDDEPDIVRLIATALRPEGFRLLTANDGETALGIARTERPTLILLDWQMPGSPGWRSVVPCGPSRTRSSVTCPWCS